MKKFKLFPFMLMPLALSSCGGSKFLGTYSFQLGRDSGAHLGVFATVTNKPYTYDDKTLGKIMNLRLNLGGASLGGILSDLDLNDVTIKTYYSIGKELGGDKGYVLNFGFNIEEVIEALFPDVPPPNAVYRDGDTPSEGEGDEPVIPEDWYDITPEQTSMFVYTTISKTTLVFNLPVSMDDLVFQLYWYGLDLSNIQVPSEEHDVGTHPTAEDIKHINEDLNYPATHDNKNFRDYHTLSLALTKK